MAKSDLQFAGEFLVEECKLLTTKGLEIDITNLLENINIYEDIYSNAISGDLLFKDTNNLVLNAPIIGEEKLSLKIQTPQQSPKLHNDDETSVIDYVTTPLQVYKINTVAQANDSALLVSVNFTTQESFRNQISRISQSYKGDPADIVEKILRDQNYLDSTRKLFVEPTANHVKMVVPNKKPFTTIQHLCEISNSKQHKEAPSYIFYETTKGFHFRSIDGLCDQEPSMVYKENIPNQLSEKGTIDPVKNLETITEMSVLSTKDTIYNMSEGFYSSKLRVHDLYNKTLKDYDFNYLENFEKDTHTDGKSPIISKATDARTQKSLVDYPDTKLYVSTTSATKHFYETEDYPYQSDNLEKTLQRRKSRMRQFERGIKLQIQVPGQTYSQAGDIIELNIAASSSGTEDKLDKQLSGKHLVTTIRHEFKMGADPRHQIYMETVKDSLEEEYPSSGPQYSNTGSAERIDV
jgi:hypothetical protein